MIPHDSENRQMDSRIHYVAMPEGIAEDAVARGVRPCARCGAELYLAGKPPASS